MLLGETLDCAGHVRDGWAEPRMMPPHTFLPQVVDMVSARLPQLTVSRANARRDGTSADALDSLLPVSGYNM